MKAEGISELLPVDEYTPGIYQIWFGTKDYFNGRNISTFYPAVQITYEITGPAKDHHIPLNLSPYGYSTYRGS
jgi:5-hydroxyisourate hydrolase